MTKSSSPGVAGIHALVGEPLRALATIGFTLNHALAVRRMRVAYRGPEGVRTTLEVGSARLDRLDIPVEPGWVRCVLVGPFPEGIVESLTLEFQAAPCERPLLAA